MNDSQIKFVSYQWKMICYYNAKVNKRSFYIGDIVLRRVFLSSKKQLGVH